jgi:hypothetical protein
VHSILAAFGKEIEFANDQFLDLTLELRLKNNQCTRTGKTAGQGRQSWVWRHGYDRRRRRRRQSRPGSV